MKTKKPIVLILMLLMLFTSTSASFAAFSDIPGGAAYSAAVDRLVTLGIFSSPSNGKFLPNDNVTREQFSRLVVIASGLEDVAASLAGTSTYTDVSPKSASSGYINTVVSKGYLGALADGKFHPADKVTYAQVCTVLVKMLGYTDQDVTGVWPANYIEKAKALGLTDGITLKSGSAVSKSTLAVMLDALLDTNIKKANQADKDKTFIESIGLDTAENYLVYSEPEVVANFNSTTTKIGSISLIGQSAIIRNTVDNTVSPAVSKIGESIVRSQIKNKDVVYQVTDKRNGKKYILVVDNKITGEITSILPDKYTPKNLQLDNVNFEISKYLDINKINGTSGAYNVGDTVTALLGYDGKVVDLATTMDQYNEDFALVLNNYSETSTDINDYNTVKYFVKLLHADGTIKTYLLDSTQTTGFNGQLVKFQVIKDEDDKDDYDTVKLENLTYLTYPYNSDYIIDKEHRMVGSDYITDNVVIFNLVSKIYGQDSNARIIKWSDMPNGKIAAEKVNYVSKIGDFGDINVMLVNNILNENTAQGLVTKIEKKANQAGSYAVYTISVAGKEFTTSTEVPGMEVGTVVDVSMSDGKLLAVNALAIPWVKTDKVEAIDSLRIKVNGAIYRFSSSAAIYFRQYDNVYERKGTDDILKDKSYGKITLYMDDSPSYGGEVSLVVVSPF